MNKVFNTAFGTVIRTEDRLMVEGQFSWLNEFLPEGHGLQTFDLMTSAKGIFEATAAEEEYTIRAREMILKTGTKAAALLAAGMAAGCEVTGIMAAGAVMALAAQNSPELLAELAQAGQAMADWVSPEDQALCEALNARFNDFVAPQISAAACGASAH